MAASLDAVSGGRVILGLGCGFKPLEASTYGFEYPDMKERLAILAEHFEIITRMLDNDAEPFSFEGQHANVDRDGLVTAERRPAPDADHGRGPGKEITFRLAAKYADILNVGTQLEEAPEYLPFVRQRCEEIGRDPDTLEFQAAINSVVKYRGLTNFGGQRMMEPHEFGFTDPKYLLNIASRAEEIAGWRDIGADEIVVAVPGPPQHRRDDLRGDRGHPGRRDRVPAAFRATDPEGLTRRPRPGMTRDLGGSTGRDRRPDELPEVIGLVDAAMRQGSDQTLRTDYPLVYAPENLANVHVVAVDGRVVATAPVLPRTISLVPGGPRVRIGIISPTATDPEFQHRGYGSACVAACIARMEALGVELSVLWTMVATFPFYELNGYQAIRPDLETLELTPASDAAQFRAGRRPRDPRARRRRPAPLDAIRALHEDDGPGRPRPKTGRASWRCRRCAPSSLAAAPRRRAISSTAARRTSPGSSKPAAGPGRSRR